MQFVSTFDANFACGVGDPLLGGRWRTRLLLKCVIKGSGHPSQARFTLTLSWLLKSAAPSQGRRGIIKTGPLSEGGTPPPCLNEDAREFEVTNIVFVEAFVPQPHV